MNPRTFCEEPSYPWAVFLTYAFDPVFFERVVLRDLGHGGSGVVLVIADGGEVERSLRAPSPLIRALGRSYVLQRAGVGGRDAPTWGAFHPKVFLRLGRAGGLAWVGTGNVTHGGWGANKELASAWRIGPEADDPGGWVAPLLRRAASWAVSPYAGEVLAPMLSLDWVRESDGLSEAPFLLTDQAPLARQIEQRWAGRRFETLDVLTGSTDRTGEMLRWAHRTFGIQAVRLGLDPRRSAFDLDGLAGLPVDLKIVPQEHPPFHAKLFWFDGPDGPAALVGSPNCSAAAWLRPASAGGNVEAAVVHDHPDPEAFADALAPFGGDGSPPADHFPALRPPVAVAEEGSRFRLAALTWDAELARIEAAFVGEIPDAEAELFLTLPGETLPLTNAGGVWTSPLPEAITLGRTIIGRVRLTLPDGSVHETPPQWLDAPHLLRHAMSGRRQAAALEGLWAHNSDNDLVEELGQLARELLTDGATYSDPLRALLGPRTKRPKDTRIVEAEVLIRSLYDTVVPLSHPLEGSGVGSFGVNGIYRAVFGDDVPEDEGVATELMDELDDDDEADDDGEGNEPAERPEPAPVAERYRKRFAQHMTKFMEGLASENFTKECTATQLRQAVGYPVAACVLGRARSWVDDTQALAWVKRSADLLLYGTEDLPPLLQSVAARYDGERQAAFEMIVGDGVLWVTLASALVHVPWTGPTGALHRMVLLADLWKADVLRASASPERIAALARRHRAEDAVAAIRDVAAPAAAAIGALEERLQETGLDLLTDPARSPRPVRAGEILWGPGPGWVLALGDEGPKNVEAYWVHRGKETKFCVAGRLVSLQEVAERDSIAERALTVLTDLIARTLQPGEPLDIDRRDEVFF